MQFRWAYRLSSRTCMFFEGDLRLATESHPFPLWQSRWQSEIPYKWAFKWIYSVYFILICNSFICICFFSKPCLISRGYKTKPWETLVNVLSLFIVNSQKLGFIHRQMGLNGKTFMFTVMLLWISRAQNSPLSSLSVYNDLRCGFEIIWVEVMMLPCHVAQLAHIWWVLTWKSQRRVWGQLCDAESRRWGRI